ncbi:hypothetical protein [Nostoc sp. WHI]|uniref:hypothetical protein n=1 Tax=Nostoc sp. WHI TaxID=2650611 RepID=UPI0018C7580E|nr:hypothetical protein [Nostoc sp. WHI]MBG1267249.1 hypothetical protein [Nostoc sp. WHI]
MALVVTTSNEPFLEESYFTSSSSWETKALRREVRRKIAEREVEASYTIFARVESRDGVDVREVVKWTHSDLYSYSQPPQVDLANFFGTLLDRCNGISEEEELAFEIQSIKFWNECRKLNQFFGMSPTYDELLSTFFTLSVGMNGLLDVKKLSALRAVLIKVRELINLTDEVLDDLLDILDEGGFDLQEPMAFEPNG